MYNSMVLRGTAQTNKVLRNTFILLATTLIPTIFGVWGGIALGVPEMMASSPWLSLGAFLLVAFVLIFGISAMANSAMAIPVLYLFTLVMGGSLSGIVSIALGKANGVGLLTAAFAGTAAILVGCGTYAATTKRDFSSMGGFLFGALLAVIVVGISNMFFQIGLLSLILAVVTLVLFSLYLVYDVQQVVNGGESNYILATVAIYLGMVNIFSSLLQILLSLGGDD